MNGFLWLVPVALVMGLAALAAFLWSLGASQYDDPEGNASRILDEEDKPSMTGSGPSGETNKGVN